MLWQLSNLTNDLIGCHQHERQIETRLPSGRTITKNLEGKTRDTNLIRGHNYICNLCPKEVLLSMSRWVLSVTYAQTQKHCQRLCGRIKETIKNKLSHISFLHISNSHSFKSHDNSSYSCDCCINIWKDEDNCPNNTWDKSGNPSAVEDFRDVMMTREDIGSNINA